MVAMDWSHPCDLNNDWFKAVTCVLLLPTDNQVNSVYKYNIMTTLQYSVKNATDVPDGEVAQSLEDITTLVNFVFTLNCFPNLDELFVYSIHLLCIVRCGTF